MNQLAVDKSRTEYQNGYYADKLEQGLIFQDVVTHALYQRGIVLVGYSSKRFQITHGENILGAEIKRDGKFRETGNLYIETAEKSHPDKPEYIPSGIYRDDNSWLYMIGDEQTLFIFSTKYLRMLYSSGRFQKKEIPTSRGFVMTLEDADKYCIHKVELAEPAPSVSSITAKL